jgi:hypothetical protein
MRNSTHRIRRSLALATAVGAFAAPGAAAAPLDPQGVNQGYHTQGANEAYATPNSVLGSAALTPAPEPTTVAADGFDWGDAGIGAAAILALGAIGAGAVVATGRVSRHRDAPHPAG